MAECVAWAVSRPAHVNIEQIVVQPLDQATASAYIALAACLHTLARTAARNVFIASLTSLRRQ